MYPHLHQNFILVKKYLKDWLKVETIWSRSEISTIEALFEHFCTGSTGYKTEPQFIVTSVTSTRVLKNSPIFSKSAKFTLTLMSKEKLNF